MTAEGYQALREACAAFSAQGIQLQTVIPVALPAEQYPAKGSGKQGGSPKPAFCGKNPSCWTAAGKPQLLSHRNPASLEELNHRIDVAERLGQPIGLAVIPSTDLAVLDFDLKNYPNPEALAADWMGLLDRYPELARTRIERTPRGGIHIYLKVSDGMASWRTPRGTLRCNFTMTPGGDHLGEVLAGTRVCVCAPTVSDVGCYELVNPDFAYCVVEVQSLGSIGIYSLAQDKADAQAACGDRLGQVFPAEDPRPPATSKVPALEELIGAKAKDVLAGGAPYRGRGGDGVDRSAQLTGFVREVYSWGNLLTEHELSFSGSAEALIAKAVAVLGIDDKADRVLDGIDPADCRHRDPDAAMRWYRRLSGEAAWGPRSGPADAAGSSQKRTGRPTLQQVLTTLVEQGLAGSELSFRLQEIASGFERPFREVESLYQGLVQEREAALDADDSLDQLEQLGATAGLDVRELIPPVLLEAMDSIRRTAEFDYSTLLAVLLAGFSAALPLRSWIELDPSEDFSQPLALWVLLLMPSGELKTPLLKRLLVQPWQQSVDEVVQQAHKRQLQEWELRKQDAENGGGQSPGPPPRLPQTLVTEDLTVQGVEVHLEIHDKWANRSVCLWLDEAAAPLRQMADPARAGKDASLGGWLLSRYDGTGARGAKVDQTRERHYRSCRLAMVAGCQPEVYREITGDADESGLSARFIVIEQLSVQQHFPTVCSEDDIRKAEALKQLLVRCYGVLARIDQLQLRLTPEAFQLFQTERAAMFQRKRASISAAERSLANKAAGRIGRLAALFHLIWAVAARAEGPIELGSGWVDADAMRRAILFNRFLLDQTIGVRLTSAGNSELGNLMLRLQRAAWEKQVPLALSELRRAFNGRNRPKAAEVLHALQVLQERGYGVLEQREYRGHQGWKYTATKPLLQAG